MTNELTKLEERLYEIVAHEIKKGEINDGLWLKAFAEADGDKQLAQALYAKLRVSSLLREAKENARGQQRDEQLRQEGLKEALRKADRNRKWL